MVLKGVPSVISPDLLHALASMGHGDEIVLADANFPASSMCAGGAKLIHAHGHDIPTILEAVLKFLPLDTYDFNSVLLMDLTNRDKNSGMAEPAIWEKYQSICDAAHGEKVRMLPLERHDFYKRAKQSYAIVATGEEAIYANIILKKGIVSSANQANGDN